MFCVCLRRMCSLLLLDGMLSNYQLSPAHLGTSFSCCCCCCFGNLSFSFICVKILLLFTLINYLWLWFSFWRLWDCSSSRFFCLLSAECLLFFLYISFGNPNGTASHSIEKNQSLDLARSVKQMCGPVQLEQCTPGGWGFPLIKFFIF